MIVPDCLSVNNQTCLSFIHDYVIEGLSWDLWPDKQIKYLFFSKGSKMRLSIT